jgi:hypothetical protein
MESIPASSLIAISLTGLSSSYCQRHHPYVVLGRPGVTEVSHRTLILKLTRLLFQPLIKADYYDVWRNKTYLALE